MSLNAMRQNRIDRLRAGLNGTKSRATSTQSSSSIFTSIALHALGRQRRGKTLTPIEKLTMGLYDKIAEDEDELNAYVEMVSTARLQGRSSGSTSGWLTPSTLTLGDDEPYTKEHFQKDFAALSAGTSSQPNCRMVDPAKGEGLSAPNKAFSTAAIETGRSTTVFWSDSENSVESANSVSADSNHFILKPVRFHCHKESGEVGKDEIYWSLAAGADTNDKLTDRQVTGETGSVKTGGWYNLASNTVLFDGKVNRVLLAHIVCWEADHSSSEWYDELIRVARIVSDTCAEMSEITGNLYWDFLIGQLPVVGEIQDTLFVIQLVSGFIADLLTLVRNDDDKVKEVFLAWNLPALDNMFSANGNHEMSVMFDGGGGGKHEMFIKRV